MLLLRGAPQADDIGALLLVCIHQLSGTGTLTARAIKVVPQHQQERFIPHCLPGTVYRVPKALLRRLHDKRHPAANLQDAPGIFLEVRREFVVVLDADLLLKKLGNQSGRPPAQ